MSEQPNTISLDKVYAEAGQWVRMCNAIVWSMGAFLVPLSVGSIGLALQYPVQQRFFAAASIFLFTIWVYVSMLYLETAADARTVLMGIEEAWGIPESMALYKLHGQVGKRWYSLRNVQIIALVSLVMAWAVFLLFRR